MGYNNCKALIQVLYPTLDLSHLPFSGIDMDKFIMEPNDPYEGVLFPPGDLPRSFGATKDPPLTTSKPADLKNGGDQMSEAGS